MNAMSASKDLSVLTIITRRTFRRISHAEAIFKRRYWNYVRVFSELYLIQKTVLKLFFSLECPSKPFNNHYG